ncbi:hypothetical protein ACWD3J_15500 [Streptomyces sp. NPDC002755]
MAIDWLKLQRIADAVARKVSFEYPGIEAEDIRQELLLHTVENQKHYEDNDYPDAQMRIRYRQIATSYAGRERYAYIYHSAEYVYTSPEIRALFEKAFFQPEMWEKPPTKDDGISVTAGGTVVALWDLDRAYGSLAPLDAEVIEKRYARGDALTSAEHMRVSRAIDRVTRFLNNKVVKRQSEAKQHDGPQLRPAYSAAN